MRYSRSPYVSNVTLKNEREAGVFKEPDPALMNLIFLLKGESDVFEVGFNMGERLSSLEASGVDITGGVEFDPMFGTYGNKHFRIYENFKVILTSLDDWFKQEAGVIYTYHWLEQFSEEDRQVLIDRIKKQAKKVFFIENFSISDTEENGGVQVYVSSNGSEVDDRATDSEQEQESSSSDES